MGIAGLVGAAVLLVALGGRTTTISGGSPEQLRTFAEALEVFERAGLEVPPVEVTFTDDASTCGVWGGVFKQNWPRDEVVLCSERLEVMVHELAHAWIYATLDPSHREKFVALRHLESWGSKDLDWRERGTEHAAEIITWALLDLDPREVRVEPRDPESLRAAARYLLGDLTDEQRLVMRSRHR